MLFAPLGAMILDVFFGALSKRRRLGLYRDDLRFGAFDAFGMDDVDALGAAISLDQQPRRIALQPGLTERDVLKRPQAVPALYAGEPITISPVFRIWAGNDQI